MLVTSKIAAADLNTHLKIIQVSSSCRLLRSVIIWISSSVITMARITPAIGTMMELERFWIMLKMSPFQPWRGLAHLYGYIRDLLVHAVEHPR